MENTTTGKAVNAEFYSGNLSQTVISLFKGYLGFMAVIWVLV